MGWAEPPNAPGDWSQVPTVARTKWMDDVNNKNVLPHSSGSETSKIKVLAELVPSRAVRKDLSLSPSF